MIKYLSDELTREISDIELFLEGIAWNPSFIDLSNRKIKTGPFSLQRIWYDFHDDALTLGVTYSEDSVKTGKKIEVFKPIRLGGVPISIVDLWINELTLLLTEIGKQKSQTGRMPDNYPSVACEKIRKLFQEMCQNEQSERDIGH